LQYDGKYTVDLTTQHNVFVVDCGNTRRQVMVIEDVDDLSKCKVYYCAGYDYKTGGINTNDYTPLGGTPIEINGAYREVHLTDMYIGSSYSPSRFYMPVDGGVNNELPVEKPIANNPIEQVCGFVLYSVVQLKMIMEIGRLIPTSLYLSYIKVSFVLVRVLWNHVMKQYGLQMTKDMTPMQLNHPMKVRIVLKRLTLSIIYKWAPIIQLLRLTIV
jgi:hypothetical protein